MIVPVFKSREHLCRYLCNLRKHDVAICLPESRSGDMYSFLSDQIWARSMTHNDAYRLSRPTIVHVEFIVPMQDVVSISNLLRIVRGQVRQVTPDDHPYCLVWRGKPYLMDGHHRTWLTAALGQEYVWMRCFHIASSVKNRVRSGA